MPYYLLVTAKGAKNDDEFPFIFCHVTLIFFHSPADKSSTGAKSLGSVNVNSEREVMDTKNRCEV